jgi:predicted anti-sigma-YlaC factor YlaD
MKCFDELVYAMFLDNELAPEKRQNAAAHLEQCPKCREQVKKMEEENRQLTKAFERNEETPDLVPVVMDELMAPGSSRYSGGKPVRLHTARWIMAAAAAVVLVGFLFFFLWLNKTPVTPEQTETETRVIICNARVEGQEVQTHIFNSDDPDIKFIWFEKI